MIDGDEGVRDLECEILAYAGFRVYSAADGDEGLELIDAHKPDLVVLDVWMPDMDGWRILERIQARGDTATMIVTSLSERRPDSRKLHEAADGYLAKPFSRSELLDAVSAALKKTRPPEPEQQNWMVHAE